MYSSYGVYTSGQVVILAHKTSYAVAMKQCLRFDNLKHCLYSICLEQSEYDKLDMSNATSLPWSIFENTSAIRLQRKIQKALRMENRYNNVKTEKTISTETALSALKTGKGKKLLRDILQ